MMTPQDVLPTLGEMAITVAGFTGIIVSFRPERAGPWSAEERIRVLGTIAGCLIVALCSLLPFAISGLPLADHFRWAAPLVTSSIFTFLTVGILARRILSGGFHFIARYVTWPSIGILVLLSSVSLLSGLGVFLPYSAGLLVLQLLWILLVASVTLVATLAITIQRGRPAE